MSKKVLFPAVVLVIICSAFITAQYYARQMKDTYLTSYTYMDFESDPNEKFEVKMSKYGLSNTLKSYENVPVGMGEERDKSTKCMGLTASFKRRAYNWLEIIPKDVKPFRGHVKRISCWVWGPHVAYKMDYILQDYQGYYWTLNVGNLYYKGWKNIHTPVPPTIPQEEAQLPRRRGLKFKKFRLTSNPKERADKLHVFFDTLKVVADTYRDLYDGWELEEQLKEEQYGDLIKEENK
ncbi:MAG TPA: flagellar filament outer layer protein FlaA [Spirochaetota bacterium]|nr:flagellar filament outer layer protein FlaA [Spirochaetota bacterium]